MDLFGKTADRRTVIRIHADDSFDIESLVLNSEGLPVAKDGTGRVTNAWAAPSYAPVTFCGIGNIKARRVVVVYDLNMNPLNPFSVSSTQEETVLKKYCADIATRQCKRLNDSVIPGGATLNRLLLFGGIVDVLMMIAILLRAKG